VCAHEGGNTILVNGDAFWSARCSVLAIGVVIEGRSNLDEVRFEWHKGYPRVQSEADRAALMDVHFLARRAHSRHWQPMAVVLSPRNQQTVLVVA